MNPEKRIKKVKSIKHYGHIEHCIVMRLPDVGIAVLEDGKKEYISWGLNYSKKEVDYFLAKTGYSFIQRNHPDEDKFEVILPPQIKNGFKVFPRFKHQQ